MDYDYLQFINAAGFQKSDDDHPAGNGVAGYRIVFKTLKLVPVPAAELNWPNLKVRFILSKTTRGGIKANGALNSRRPNMVILPEYIDDDNSSGKPGLKGRTNMKFEFQAWEEEIDDSAIVEMILITDAKNPQEVLSEGRFHLSKMKIILELAAGSRLLGLPITEEVVEIFPDWHWNRNMSSVLATSESTLDLELLNTNDFFETIRPVIEGTQEISHEERRQIGVASSWYWKAESEPDPINRYIEYWIAVEALEMPNTTNVRPIRDRLQQITGHPADEWKLIVGKLFGLRSDLVHGKIREIETQTLEQLRCLLLALLYYRLFGKTEHYAIDRFLFLSKVSK